MLGESSRAITRRLPAPLAIEASMNSIRRSDITWPRIGLAT